MSWIFDHDDDEESYDRIRIPDNPFARAMDRHIMEVFNQPDDSDLVELEHMWALPARGEGV